MTRKATTTKQNATENLRPASKLVQVFFVVATAILVSLVLPSVSMAQPEQCDPAKVMSSETCAKCHAPAVQVWKQTPHFKTFTELSRNPEAKAICRKLGLKSAKRSDVCINCHYTMKESNGRSKVVAGVSCESCHGASKEWISTHNDYGGPTATKETESAQHAAARLAQATEAGMRNTRNVYLIASSCLNCHTVPNERLVNIGGHKATSDGFELVSWSQGQVRHNFLRDGAVGNAKSSPERLRIMYVVGLIADLEYSTRATAKATQKSTYGVAVANRAARVSLKLYKLQQQINDPNVQTALLAFSEAELKTENEKQLLTIADQIREAGKKFATETDGSSLDAVDSLLPDPSTYK